MRQKTFIVTMWWDRRKCMPELAKLSIVVTTKSGTADLDTN